MQLTQCPSILQVAQELEAAGQQHEKLVADSAGVLCELQEWQDKASALLDELSKDRAAHEATQQQLQAALDVHEQERLQWAHERAGFQVGRGQVGDVPLLSF